MVLRLIVWGGLGFSLGIRLNLSQFVHCTIPQSDFTAKTVEEALEQIDKKHYIEVFEKEGYTTILKFGVACYKKRCRIKLG